MPSQWRAMARADRLMLLGYDRWRDRQRRALADKLQPSENFTLEYLAIVGDFI